MIKDKLKNFVETLKFTMFYTGIKKPDIFSAIQYFDEDKAIELIKKYNLVKKHTDLINFKAINEHQHNILTYCLITNKYKLVKELLSYEEVSCTGGIDQTSFLKHVSLELSKKEVKKLLPDIFKKDISSVCPSKYLAFLVANIFDNSPSEHITTKFLKALNLDPFKPYFANQKDILEYIVYNANYELKVIAHNVKAVLNTYSYPQEYLEKQLNEVINDKSVVYTLIKEKVIEFIDKEKVELETKLAPVHSTNAKKMKI